MNVLNYMLNHKRLKLVMCVFACVMSVDLFLDVLRLKEMVRTLGSILY